MKNFFLGFSKINPVNLLSAAAANVSQLECWHVIVEVELFFIMNFLNFLR